MIVAIDQSLTNTGICYISRDGERQTFLVKTTAKMQWEHRMDKFLSTLDSIMDLSAISLPNKSKVEHVVLESYAFGGSIKGFVLGELGGVIKYHMYRNHCIPARQILIAYPKMFVARNGRANKKQVISSLKSRFEIEEKNDNIADAISIGLTYQAYLKFKAGELEGISMYDRAVLTKLRRYLKDD